jgi:riboflavin synthase
MFSGIVEETGVIRSMRRSGGSVVFSIDSRKVARGVSTDDSVSVNGVCLTVIGKWRDGFRVQAVEETLKKTNLGGLSEGDRVNLERSLRIGDRIGGHFVLGHVDCVGTVVEIEKRKSSKLLCIAYPPKYKVFLIPVGSICVEGVSLTVAELKSSRFTVSVIPHTLRLTTFNALERGAKVNLEFDMIGKYVARLMGRA